MRIVTILQIVLWDLSLERDAEGGAEEDKLKDLPPQLLFIHQEYILPRRG